MNQLRPFLQARIAFYSVICIGVLMLSGCSRPSNSCHWLYDYIPENRAAIGEREGARQLAWALLGNDDDGIFGEKDPKFKGAPCCLQALNWQLRNPLHNFCFYVIGTAYKENDELDILKITGKGVCVLHYHAIAKTIFPDENSCFYLGLHGGKPFMSLRIRYTASRQLDLYAGWRERGNFGLKCSPGAKPKTNCAQSK